MSYKVKSYKVIKSDRNTVAPAPNFQLYNFMNFQLARRRPKL